MIFRPTASRGGLIGLAVLGGLVAIEIAIAVLMRSGPAGPRAAVIGLLGVALVPVVGRVAFWAWGYFRLRYEVSRDGLIIHWAATRQVVPMGDIVRIRSGRPYEGKLRGVRWPGYHVGHARVDAGDEETVDALVYATAPPEQQLLIMTGGGMAYAISPADRDMFVEEFKLRKRLGPVQPLEEETQRPAFFRLPVWSDEATLRLLILALALNALLFASTAWRYPGLPPEIVLQYRFEPGAGLMAGPLRLRNAIWSLPAIGLGALAVNAALAVALHHRARLGAALLAIGAVIMQIAVAVALWRVA